MDQKTGGGTVNIKTVQEGMVCDRCIKSAGLILIEHNYTTGHNKGMCKTCGVYGSVLHTDEHIVPAGVNLIGSQSVLELEQELCAIKKMFRDQTELYVAACDRIESLETELRKHNLGSKWSGIT